MPRRNKADLARAPRVRAAARAEVEALYLDDSQLALARRVLSERHARGLLRRDVVDSHTPFVPDYFVSAINRALNLFIRRVSQINVNLGGVGHHSEAARLRAVEFDERLREYVLPRVLLHVVEPARPVNHAAHARPRLRHTALDDVQHLSALSLDAVNDARAAEQACVCGLAAARRVEGRSVEHHRRASFSVRRDGDNARVELDEVRVVVVETFGRVHRDLHAKTNGRGRAASSASFDRRECARR